MMLAAAKIKEKRSACQNEGSLEQFDVVGKTDKFSSLQQRPIGKTIPEALHHGVGDHERDQDHGWKQQENGGAQVRTGELPGEISPGTVVVLGISPTSLLVHDFLKTFLCRLHGISRWLPCQIFWTSVVKKPSPSTSLS